MCCISNPNCTLKLLMKDIESWMTKRWFLCKMREDYTFQKSSMTLNGINTTWTTQYYGLHQKLLQNNRVAECCIFWNALLANQILSTHTISTQTQTATHCFARTHKDLVLAMQYRRLLQGTYKDLVLAIAEKKTAAKNTKGLGVGHVV